MQNDLIVGALTRRHHDAKSGGAGYRSPYLSHATSPFVTFANCFDDVGIQEFQKVYFRTADNVEVWETSLLGLDTGRFRSVSG